MILEATAPNRIDLAGGTLDIYPIYLFEEGSITINAAVNVMSVVRLKVRPDPRVRIYSEDLQERLEAASIDALPTGGPLDLIVRLLRFYSPNRGLDVVTRNSAPAGSGLGASSSLLIAMSAALNRVVGDKYSKDDLIHLGANLEAQTLRVPTGKQDYYPAAFGGINCLWFGIEHPRIEPLELSAELVATLNERLILSFTGAPRSSGASNWQMVKSYIDSQAGTVERIRRIRGIAHAVRKSLLDGDLDSFGRLLAEEWSHRRQLADGVTNQEIDRIVSAASDAGALGSKVCGAGAGGCMITLAQAGARERVATALRSAGATLLNFKIEASGVRVRQSRQA